MSIRYSLSSDIFYYVDYSTLHLQQGDHAGASGWLRHELARNLRPKIAKGDRRPFRHKLAHTLALPCRPLGVCWLVAVCAVAPVLAVCWDVGLGSGLG